MILMTTMMMTKKKMMLTMLMIMPKMMNLWRTTKINILLILSIVFIVNIIRIMIEMRNLYLNVKLSWSWWFWGVVVMTVG